MENITNTSYVSLNTHSSWSLGLGLSTPKQLFEKAKEMGSRAVCVTDYDSMAGMWDCLKLSRETGIKFIAGCEFNFVDDLDNKDDTRLTKIVLIAKNSIGYKNMLALRKHGFDLAYTTKSKSYSRISWDLLKKHSQGLICLSGDGNGYISQIIMNDGLVKEAVFKFYNIFKEDFALQLMPNNLQIKANPASGPVDQRKINIGLKKIHEEFPHIKCIVATGSYYTEKEHHESHDVLLAISSGQPVYSGQRLKFDKKDFYIKTEEEVRSYFSRHTNLWSKEFVDSMFKNIDDFVDSCEESEWIDPKFSNVSGKELPEFPVADQDDYSSFLIWVKDQDHSLKEDVLYYRYIVQNGLDKKIKLGRLNKDDEKKYKAQIDEELDVLEYHGFSSYMLIVYDILRWCRDNNIPVGPGRGSVTGSFTAYLIDIHAVNPFKYGTIFARFHNKQKTSLPDIDVDIAPSGRDRLHTYLRNKYGDDCVAHVSNINTITPKVYARDIARVFEFGDDGRTAAAAIGDDIADSISSEYSRVTTALAQAPLFQEYAKQYPELAKHAILGGKSRAWSTHAAGLVISKRPLHEIVPVRRDPHGALCLEYEKVRAEENGLVKMDTLGLETLDIIERTYSLIKSVGKTPPDYDFDYDAYDGDQKTYDMISQGQVGCVFQLTGVAYSVCKMLQPKNIEDIALITALIRPAAKAIIDDFMKVRTGEREMNLIHPRLERALKLTNGFGLYEECLMYIAADIAGWDLHKADDLRKMTKDKGKYPEKVEALKNNFIDDSVKNGVDRDISIKIWEDIIGDFGGYGFNIAHSTAYSMITFKAAYLKAHFPLEFLVANLMSKVSSNNPKSKDEVIRIKREIRALGVNIVPPDINTSDITYKIINDNTLMTGLDGLRNVKEASIEELKEKRPFNNFKDLIERTDTSKCKSSVIQSLAAAGALDSFGLKREQMFFYCSDYRKKLGALKTSLYKKVDKGKLTKEAADLELSEFVYPFPENEKLWMPHEIFAIEEHFLGEGITGSLKDRFPKFFDDKVIDFSSLPKIIDYIEYSDDERENRRANTHNIDNHGIFGLKGIITNLFEFKVKKEDSKIFGQVMARLTVEDLFGNPLDIIAFPSTWETAKGRVEKELSGGKAELKEGMAIYFNGAFQWENEHTYSFILGDILSYKDSPKIPKSLKSKSVKIPRKKSLKKSDIMELSKEDLADELEDEMLFDGSSTIKDDEYDFR